ncbi:MAG: phosphoglycerate dehydrogenase, partial [Candidatus Sumerlaeia bacterium]|nr:phosphoglycerate dehydrogenase [Candidatus Sumerlaeia bacterium]
MPKILIGDSLSKEGIKILQQGPGFEVDYKPEITPEELKSIIPQYDALVVRSRTKVPKDVINVADRLRLIGRAGAGVDTIDVEAATKKGIIVMNTPGGNTISTAELAFALMLALVRKIPQAHITMLEGKWDKKSFTGHEVNEKTLGIIGFGRIGREMAKRALAFGMRLIAYDLS